MRVLILSQYFPPEIGATQARIHSFAAGLAERGHRVEVVCEVPNHPQGVVREGFRGRAFVRRRLDGFGVTYVWVHARREKTSASRLAFYASYAAMATLAGALRPRPDVVFASSPPLPVAAAGAAIARRHRVPWVMDVRDLWPEAAVAMGELSNPRLLAAAAALAQRLYRSAGAITVTTEAFRDAIAVPLGGRERITVLPNGTTRLWTEGAALEPDRESLGLPPDVFLWTFAGNVGRAQGIEAAVDAAARLGDGFRLLILGDGPARRALEDRAAATGAAVEFHDQVEPAQALRFVRASDALLVSLSADPVFSSFVPSKLFDFCAAGRPVVLVARGEAERLASQAGAALTVTPGDPDALAQAIEGLRGDSELRERLAAAGRKFGAGHRRENQIERLEEVLETAVSAS
jgi:glycosyltransferase involved in cell wall biosynthesis